MKRFTSMRAFVIASIGLLGALMGGCPINAEQPDLGFNLKPIADAGPSQSLSAGATVILSAAASTDADGDPLTYAWTQITGPRVTLQNANQQQTSFLAREPGTYEFTVTVSDGLASDDATVRVNIGQADGTPPIPDPLPPDDGGETPPAPPQPRKVLAQSTFDADDEGWTIDGFNPVWSSNGGRRGGHLSSSADDAWEFTFWNSPEIFAGDFSAAYGGTLEFSISESNPSSQLADSGQSLVILNGGGLSIRKKVTANASRNAWVNHTIRLDPSGGWLRSPFGERDDAASADDIRAVLAELSEVQIRARWGQRLEASTTRLDEVAIRTP